MGSGVRFWGALGGVVFWEFFFGVFLGGLGWGWVVDVGLGFLNDVED